MSNPYAPPRPGGPVEDPPDGRPAAGADLPRGDGAGPRPADGHPPVVPPQGAPPQGAPPQGAPPQGAPPQVGPPPGGAPWLRGTAPVPPAPKPPPDPEVIRAAGRTTLDVTVLILATLLTAGLALPWQLGAIPIGLVTIVLGIRSLRRLIRAGLGRSPLVLLLALGLGFTSLTVFGTASTLTIYSIQMDHQTCLANALTISATQTCEETYQAELASRVSSWTSLLTPATGG